MQSNELKNAFSGLVGEVLWIKCVWDTRENETELVCFGCEVKTLLCCVFLGFVVAMVCSSPIRFRGNHRSSWGRAEVAMNLGVG